jgi:hypothetical protein
MLWSIALASALFSDRSPEPVLWLRLDGVLQVPRPRLLPGTGAVRTPDGGWGLELDGIGSGIELPDDRRLQITRSLTISAWLFPTLFTNEHNSAPGAQILFRGDDRSGLDPYHLTVLSDGTVAFAVNNLRSQGSIVTAPIQTRRWTHVLGSLDDNTGEMKLFLDGRLVARKRTSVRPFRRLDIAARPGIGIGNVQAASGGAHNQPYHGKIADLRLYNQALDPRQVGFDPAGWNTPRQSLRE